MLQSNFVTLFGSPAQQIEYYQASCIILCVNFSHYKQWSISPRKNALDQILAAQNFILANFT